MFASHNLRMINPAVSQTPLLQNIKAIVPSHLICSKTVKIRNYVWIDTYDHYIPQHEQETVESINRNSLSCGGLAEYLERQTEVVDPLLPCINVKVDGLDTDFASITPAPCCGLYDEVVKRENENPYVILSAQRIEFKPERYLEHGRMIEQNAGILKTFNLPQFDRMPFAMGNKLDSKYVVLEFNITGFNVATGMLGLGLPPITLLGVFFNSYFGKVSEQYRDTPFAVGIANIEPMFMSGHIHRQFNNSQNNQRKANFHGYFVFEVSDDEHAHHIMNSLELDFSIANAYVANKRIVYTDQLPRAFWMREMTSEVNSRLAAEPYKDSLDVAFDFANQGRLFCPVASGFAMFDKPEPKTHMENIKHAHAWSESVFSSTELIYGDFTPQYFYHRKFEKLLIQWTQD